MNRWTALLRVVLAASLGTAGYAHAEWQMKPVSIATRFAAAVKPDNVLPEYPRPQLTRDDWLNLNGLWEFEPGKEGDTAPIGRTLTGTILVPFAVESAMSGVMEHHERLWYRRAFYVPAGWRGKQILLHFGAVDYETEVFLNGKTVGTHKGGYDPFTMDLTPALSGDGAQELIVRVYDPSDNGGQPRGKQTLHPGGAMYTTVTGIWQTVWLEPVKSGGVENLTIVPDVDGGLVKVTVDLLNGVKDASVEVAVKDGPTVVATQTGSAGQVLSIKIPDAKLWSPGSPHLYDLDVTVRRGQSDEFVDTVGSYFGMRKIELGTVDGVKKIMLNGKFVFQIGPLDQGFWPETIYTPPSDAAIEHEIRTTQAMGFNFIRKHLKVEPARWYYWADKLGMLVWQDMPSPNSYLAHAPPVDKAAFERELTRMVLTLRNVPSIILWVPFNESQGQHDTARYVKLIKTLDPTRLVNEGSGGTNHGAGDVLDLHTYPTPIAPPPNATMALACGEYGGVALKVPGHMWREHGGGYMDASDANDLLEKYSELTYHLKDLRDNHGLSAAVYTQLTDVETEINGLQTYDRVPKVDVTMLAKANHFELAPPTYNVIVPTSEHERQTWRYTTQRPAGDAWTKAGFDDASWKQGPGGFGSNAKGGTAWKTDDIWLRRSFMLPKLTAEQLQRLRLSANHDDDVDVYINGVLAYHSPRNSGDYANVKISDEARKALVLDGENTLAVHCHEQGGGSFVDVGLIDRISGLAGMK